MAVGEVGDINVTDQPLYLNSFTPNIKTPHHNPMKSQNQVPPTPAITQQIPAFTQKVALPLKSI